MVPVKSVQEINMLETVSCEVLVFRVTGAHLRGDRSNSEQTGLCVSPLSQQSHHPLGDCEVQAMRHFRGD